MDHNELSFWVGEVPKPQPRPRVNARGAFANIYNPPTADAWKAAVEAAAIAAMRAKLAGPLLLHVDFYLPRPKSHLKKCGTLKDSAPLRVMGKPDLDNLIKSTMDALTRSGIWQDDAQVVGLSANKQYEFTTAQGPGARIRVCEA